MKKLSRVSEADTSFETLKQRPLRTPWQVFKTPRQLLKTPVTAFAKPRRRGSQNAIRNLSPTSPKAKQRDEGKKEHLAHLKNAATNKKTAAFLLFPNPNSASATLLRDAVTDNLFSSLSSHRLSFYRLTALLLIYYSSATTTSLSPIHLLHYDPPPIIIFYSGRVCLSVSDTHLLLLS